MKGIVKRFITISLLSFACFQSVSAQSIESQMRSFFSYNDNQAYWWTCLFAHPTNDFYYGTCDMVGNDVYLVICSKCHNPFCSDDYHNINLKIHKNGKYFDSIVVCNDTDCYPAYRASDKAKQLAQNYFKNSSYDVLRYLESYFGKVIENMNSKELNLCVLTYLLWKYPY